MRAAGRQLRYHVRQDNALDRRRLELLHTLFEELERYELAVE